MKDFIKTIGLIICVIFLCGFDFSTNIIDENNYINNDDYIDYEQLDKEDKKDIEVVPPKHVVYEELNGNKISNRVMSIFENVTSTLESRYNLMEHGVTFDIEDQGAWGLCWAFATNNVLESYLQLHGIGTYNLSENQPAYVGKYIGDIKDVSGGNSPANVAKYWYYGYSPVTENYFGPYFTEKKSIEINKYMNTDNTAIDVRDVKYFNSFNTEAAFSKYDYDTVVREMNNYNSTLKEWIKENGAIYTSIYTKYFDFNTNFVYDDGSHTDRTYVNTGHGVTIIGWDDEYGEIVKDGKTYKGSWIALNSWGESNRVFYISYYDVTVVKSLLGVSNAKIKEWDNIYTTSQYSEKSSTNQMYTYYVGDEKEVLDTVKIYYASSGTTPNNPTVHVTVTSNGNTTTSTNVVLKDGITSFYLNHIEVSGDVNVYVYGANSLKYTLSVYTMENSNNKDLYLREYTSNEYFDIKDNELKFHGVSKNMNVDTNYSVNVFDMNNNDITSKFTITKGKMLNNYFNFTLKETALLNTDSIKVKVTIGNIVKEKNYTLLKLDSTNKYVYVPLGTNANSLLKLTGASKDMFVADANNNKVADTLVAQTGQVITNSQNSSKLTIVVKGDTNGDGKITISDAIKASNYFINGTSNETKKYLVEACDFNNDGKITMSDAIKISNYFINYGEI